MKDPLNRLVALVFVEEIAAKPFAAVNVQFVQERVPVEELLTETAPPPAVKFEFVATIVAVELFAIPGSLLCDPPVIVEFEIVTWPVLAFCNPGLLPTPPVKIEFVMETDPEELF